MAVLLVDPDDPALNIRAAISAAASGDMILMDPNDTNNLQLGLIDDVGVGIGVGMASAWRPGPIRSARRSIPPSSIRPTKWWPSTASSPDPDGNNFKGIAQFWENGGGAAFPPGTWETWKARNWGPPSTAS